MSRSLKVYGWHGWRHEAKPRPQTREIVAAHSLAEVMRITGETRSNLWNICETGNEKELEVALAEPGVVFWRELDDHKGAYARATKEQL